MNNTPVAGIIEVNGKSYELPDKPVAVICLDGSADEYISAARARSLMPNVHKMELEGYRGMVRGALPSFTNVNNTAIVTGLTPRETGICGNYFFDPDKGEEVMMNSPEYLRCDTTILAEAAKAGRRVAMITAKDKLRALLARGMDGISISAEKAREATLDVNGIEQVEELVGPTPEIYSAEASLYVLNAGIRLLEAGKADFLYLSLTDYMQHKYAPEDPEVLAFYADIDKAIGRLVELGAIVGATADHGMNAKCDDQGNPRVIYLESLLEERFGPGFRVICPITDPYVVHHGALGAAVTVYLPEGIDPRIVMRWLQLREGITEVYDKVIATHILEQPQDRIGDIFVLCGRDWVLGRTPEHHDLSQLAGRLRSHGGRYEEMVPMLLSHPLNEAYRARAQGDPRNFDIFDFVCNGTQL